MQPKATASIAPHPVNVIQEIASLQVRGSGLIAATRVNVRIITAVTIMEQL